MYQKSLQKICIMGGQNDKKESDKERQESNIYQEKKRIINKS